MGTSQKREGGLWTAGFGEVGATLKALQDQGVLLEDLARLRSDVSYATRVARIMVRGGLQAPVSEQSAFSIMGKNFFGIEDWAICFGLRFSDKEIREVLMFPWGEDVLDASCPFVNGKKVRETHFAFLGLSTVDGEPLTINKLREVHPPTKNSGFMFDYMRSDFVSPQYRWGEDPWYQSGALVTTKTCGFRWYLVPLAVPRCFRDKTYTDQVAAIPPEYEVLFAVEEVAKNVLYFVKNGAYLNWEMYYGQFGGPHEVTATCRDVALGHDGKPGQVSVGISSQHIGIYVGDNEASYDSRGLAVSRKI